MANFGLCGENSLEEIDGHLWQCSISFGLVLKSSSVDAGSTFNKVGLRAPASKVQS